MADPITVGMIAGDGDSARLVRDVVRGVGCAIVHDVPASAFDPVLLAVSGASVIIVDLTPDAEIDAIFALLDDSRYRVIFNEADVTSRLSGWDQARWARHLAAKILGVTDAVDPPRPGELATAASQLRINTEAPQSHASLGPGREMVDARSEAPSATELGIDDWLNRVMEVKDPASHFALENAEPSEAQTALESAPLLAPMRNLPAESPTMMDLEPVGAAEDPVNAPPATMRTAAEERFDFNISDVIRDIDEWLPKNVAAPSSRSVMPGAAARLWSRPAMVNEPAALDESALSAGSDESARSPDIAGSPETSPGSLDRSNAATTRVQSAVFAISAKPSARLQPMELTPLDEAALASLLQLDTVDEPEMRVDLVADRAQISRVIVMCASVGGPEAIRELLGALPAQYPALFLVVQQVGEEFLDLLSQQLRRSTALRVRSADLGDELRDGDVVPVSPRQRLRIDRSGRVVANERLDGQSSVSINQVLRDASDSFGNQCAAIVLSGVASDAAEGCRYLAENGGRVYVQAAASCVSSAMVEQVQRTGVVSFQGTPSELAAHLLIEA